MTTGEAARLLGVTRQHIINLTNQGMLRYTMAGSHRRVRRGDVLRLAGRAGADRGGPMTRDQIRSSGSTESRRAMSPEIRSGHSCGLASDFATCSSREMSGEPWLRRWQDLIDEGPEPVMRAMTAIDPRARELRQNSPFLGLLTLAERTAALSAFERFYPQGKRVPDHALP